MIQYMKPIEWERATVSRNDYGEKIKSYSSIGTVNIFIAFDGFSEVNNNNVLFDNYTHIGLTRETSIKKDDRLGGKYIVKYTLESKPFYRIFLEEIENGSEN